MARKAKTKPRARKRPTPITFTQWDLDRVAARARLEEAEKVRARDFRSILEGMLRQVPPGNDGMLHVGISVAQATAVAAVLGRIH